MTDRSVRIFQATFDLKFREKFLKGCEQIFDEGFLANHTFTRRFEAEFSNAAGSSFALGVTNGTSSIELPLHALDIRGKEVLVQTNTFIATAAAVENAGGIPIPVDLEEKYFCLSPEALENSITKNTGAVVVVHIAGLVSPYMNQIVEICKRNNLPLIEDCAQAYGSSFNGTRVGNFGVAGAFSFQVTKNMTTGEGGAVIINDEKFYQLCRSSRQFGMSLSNSTLHERRGSNFKMSEFVALMGLCELDRVQERIAKRQALAKRYQENLHGSNWLTIKPAEKVVTGYYKQVILSPLPRQLVAEELKKKRIDLTGGVYFTPLHRQPIYLGKFDDTKFPVSNRFSENHICPPVYPELTFDDIDYVSEALLSLSK